jgi:chemotaxis protein histidine kinase CheA
MSATTRCARHARRNDEIGDLARGLNGMLAQIEQRDCELERRVVERTSELSQAKELAERRARQERIPGHDEPRDPHADERHHGMTELLRQTPLDDRQRRFAGFVSQSANHLLSIINDILDFSKIEAQKVALESINFDLRETMEDVVLLFAQQAHAKGLELVCDIPETCRSRSAAIPVRLRQVGDEPRQQCGQVHRQGRDRAVASARAESAESVRVASRSATPVSAFRRTRASASSRHSCRPTLDDAPLRRHRPRLAIARRLIAMMGGTLELDSEPGRGTTFWFELELPKQDAFGAPRFGLDDALAACASRRRRQSDQPRHPSAPARRLARRRRGLRERLRSAAPASCGATRGGRSSSRCSTITCPK